MVGYPIFLPIELSMLKFFRRKKGDGTTPTDPNITTSNNELPDSSATEQIQSTETLEALETIESIEPQPPEPAPENTEQSTGWFSKLKNSLSRTRTQLTSGLVDLFLGKKEIDADLLENIETHLLMADVGVEATQDILKTLTQGISRKELNDPAAVYTALQQALTQMLIPCESPLLLDKATLSQTKTPYVILMIGINGAGKTTTIGKMAKKYTQAGLKVMLAAGDTFRAAAVEQLQAWGERNQVPVVAQHSGADSASVIFDALQSAQSKGIDVLIADTAGRLHTRENLMDELKKIKRVMQKLDPQAPHEVMLVLDAGTGQNALLQADKFHADLGVTGITLTKLDGTAKGGIIFAIANKLRLPIRFIGVGEKVEDLRPFEASAFVNALFDTEPPKG